MPKKKNEDNEISEALARRISKIVERGPASDGKSETVRSQRADPRAAERDPAYRQALLVFGMGEKLPVVIKNVSDTGAMIEFFAQVPLTENVTLRDATLGTRKARVIWQLPGEAGLRFVDEADA